MTKGTGILQPKFKNNELVQLVLSNILHIENNISHGISYNFFIEWDEPPVDDQWQEEDEESHVSWESNKGQ